MQYQDIPGIYVYRADIDKKVTFEYYETIEDLFRRGVRRASDIRNEFGTDVFEKVRINEVFKVSKSCVYDENCNFYTVDRLIGLYRKYRREMLEGCRWWFRSPWGFAKGNKAGGSMFRRPQTFRDRKWSLAYDEENYVKVRPKRNMKNLPSTWDDVHKHHENGWKWQSKRRHQWR